MTSSSTLNYSTSDPSSSSFSEDCSLVFGIAAEDSEFTSYDDFCALMRRRVGEDINTPQVRPKKFSYVRNWRSGVGPADLTILVPPSPLFQSFDSPSSPVASIDLSRLCVTSIPPSECEVYQLSDPASSHERSAVVEIPAEFHEIYDADLGRTVTLEASEIVSPSSLPTLTFPEANKPQCLVPSGSSSSKFKPARLQSVSSTIRWLPTRIKYIILSQTTVRK